MECLIASAITPSVFSPPCICAIGMFSYKAGITADKISNLSPSMMIRSGAKSLYAFANPLIPSAVE